MTSLKCLALLAVFAANTPAASLLIGTVSGSAGQTVNLNVTLQTEGAQISGVQFDIFYDKAILGVTVVPGAASTAAQKQISTSSPTVDSVRVIIAGLNQTLIGDGNVASLAIAIAANASAGNYPLTFSGVSGTNPSGDFSLKVSATDGGVVLPGGGGSPVLAISKTHSGNFVAGQSGAAYGITVSNQAGAGVTSGAVTVTETVPTGLTLVSIAGTGWSCSGTACSRSDTLSGGASYPVIAVAVNVATNAPSTVTNQVSVSGGGSVTSFANDPTTVVAASNGTQTITFASPGDVSFGTAPFPLSATASSGLPVSFASTTQSVCTVSGSTLSVVSLGTCTVTATQAGNGTFTAATPVSRSFNVIKGTQSISFTLPGFVAVGSSPFTLTATATSGLAVLFTSTTLSVCTVNGNTLTAIAAGTCSVTASQPGNANYQEAPAVTRTLTVGATGGANAPSVLQGGVVPVYSTSTTVQAGSWISIFGTNLAPSILVWDGTFPVPQSLGGVSVTINDKPGYLWFVSPAQINLQVPDDPKTGSVSVVVNTPAGSFTSTVTLGAASPSLSLLDSKHVAALAPNAGGGYDVVGAAGAFGFATQPVAPGAPLVLYGVGFGPTDPPVKSGLALPAPAATVNKVTVTIGGVNAPVLYSGLVGVGLYQINVTVPPGTPSGDQPIRASVSGLQTSAGNVVTIK